MGEFELYQNELWGVSTSERKRLRKQIAAEEHRYLQYFDPGPPPPSLQKQQAICDRLSKSFTPATKKFQRSQEHSHKGLQSGLREDILTQPAPTETDKKFWIYVAFRFSRQEQNPLRQVKKLIDNALKSRVPGSKYGLLFDIVTTSSTIMSGAPHHLADQIYRYVDSVYGDRPGLKFVFVGITDNDNCRTARDVFCKEDVSGHPKKPFEAIDNNHLYAVFPFDEELPLKLMIMQQLEEKLQTTTTIQPKSKRSSSPLASLDKNTLLVSSQERPPPTPMQPMLTLQKRRQMASTLPRIRSTASVTNSDDKDGGRDTSKGDDPEGLTKSSASQRPSSLLRMLPPPRKTFTTKSSETSHKSSMKTFLPTARPYENSNPFDGSPFMLEKRLRKLQHFQPVPMSTQLSKTLEATGQPPTDEDFSFFLTQQLAPPSDSHGNDDGGAGEGESSAGAANDNVSTTPK